MQSGQVVQTRPVNADGSYSFVDMTSGDYEVIISTTTATIGQSNPTQTLPSNWINTGEFVGAGAGNDGLPNGRLSVTAINGSVVQNVNFGIKDSNPAACEITGTNGGGFTTTIQDVVQNCDGTYTITARVDHSGCGGPSCKSLSHYSIEAAAGTYSNVSVNVLSGSLNYNYANGPNLGSDPFSGFKLDNTSGIGGGNAGSFTVTYTLTSLQNQQFSAKAGTSGQITSFTIANFQSVMNCKGTTCAVGSISGNVFNDINGLTDNLVNGMAISAPSSVPLYATLLNSGGSAIQTTAITNGTYTFSNVPVAGTYSVVLATTQNATTGSLPASWTNTGDQNGSSGVQAPANGKVTGISVAASSTTSNINFGIREELGTITGSVFNDTDGLTNTIVDGSTISSPDGNQLHVTLINSSNAIVGSMPVTAGTYSFSNVTAGSDYKVVLSTSVNGIVASLPTNWINTGENASTAGVQAPTDGVITGLTVTAGGTTSNVNFGIKENTGTLSGIVYQDNNALIDNLVNGNPVSVVNSTQLYATLLKNNVLVESKALVNGTYSFTDLHPSAGDYSVVLTQTLNGVTPSLPGGWLNVGENASTAGIQAPTDGIITNLSVTAGGTTNNVNFGIVEVSGIAGNVYNDVDNNGNVNGTAIYNPDGTPLYATLLNSSNALVSSMAVTNAGTYAFTGLPVGTYTVVLTTSLNSTSAALPTNWLNTGERVGLSGNDGAANGLLSATVTAGATTFNANFGIRKTIGNLSGKVFNDINGNANVDGNSIYNPDGNQLFATLVDGSNAAVASVAVATNGTYSFNDVLVGNYTVVLTNALNSTTPFVPANWINTGENVGLTGNDGNANGIVSATISIGTTTSNVNFGIRSTLGSISGNVYNDTDNDADVDGVAIFNPASTQLYATLLDNLNALVSSVAIANDGTYTFGDLTPGNYSVVVTNALNSTTPALPANWINTGENLGTSGNDGNANGTLAVTVALGTDVYNANFGIRSNLGNLSGNVYDDMDADADVDGSGINMPDGTQVYATLVNASNAAVATVAVGNDGSYSFNNITAGNYTVVLSTTSNSTTASLPVNWINTGENVGLVGNDGSADGVVAATISAGTTTSNVNFGIRNNEGALAGKVFNDTNADANVDGVAIYNPDGTQLYATLLDGASVEASVAVGNDGSYLFSNVGAGNYTVIITTTLNGTTPALPAGWDNTGENVGLVGNDGNANGSVAATVVVANTTTDVNFGIRYVLGGISGTVMNDTDGDASINGTGINNPSATPLYANLLNSSNAHVSDVAVAGDGTYSFSGLTAGNYSVVISTSQGATSASIPAGWIHVGENIGTPGNDGNADGKLAATVAIGSTTSNVNFGILYNLGNLSGKVFDDMDGDSDVDGSAIYNPDGNQLYATLVDGTNTAVATVAVSNSGTYTFTDQTPGNYTVVLSTTSNSTSASLPVNWLNTGENVGLSGNDGAADGVVAATISAGTTTSNVNFGIRENLGAIAGNIYNDVNADANVDGTGINNPSATPLYATLVDNLNALVSSVAVANDGSYGFNGLSAGNYTVILTTALNSTSAALPVSWVNTGENVGLVGNDGTANGILSASVTAGNITAEANFGIMQLATGLSGNVFNDANGLTDNTVNGSGINTATASLLYINVLDGSNNVVATTAVNLDGSYSITGINAGNYTVALSTTAGVVGQPAPALGLPAGWVSTGENVGVAAGNDGSIDSRIAATVTLGNVTSQVNFGIEELPVAGTSTAVSQANPGDAIVVPVAPALFVSSDNDGNVSSITITAFPSNTTTLEVNGFGYTVGTFPIAGVTIPTDVNGIPLQTVNVDPIDGAVSVVIPFTVKDNAGFESATPGSVTLPFTAPLVDIINNYPAFGFNSFACEDLWPYPGDYDLNDLVIDYQFKITTTSTMILKEVEITYVVKAVGAEFQNGFGFQFNTDVINPADIVSATGSVLSENYITLAPNGLEAGQSKPTFILYDNSFNIMPFPG